MKLFLGHPISSNSILYSTGCSFTAKKQKQPLKMFYKPVLGSLFETPTHVLSFEFCKIFKSTYFQKHLRTAAFEKAISVLKK